MYHSKIIPNGVFVHKQTNEVALRAYFLSHEAALGHAAVMLDGLRGARLINSIRDAFGQPSIITHRLRCNLLDLRCLLFLEHLHEGSWSEDAFLAQLEPTDPIVPEICLIADGFDDALRYAGLIELTDTETA